MDSVSISYGKYEIDTFGIVKKDSIALIFAGDYNDSLGIIVNGYERKRIYISNKNNPYPNAAKGSDYTGIDYTLSHKRRDKEIILLLIKQKHYVKLNLEKKYPFCVITYYNSIWKINYQYLPYEIKINIIVK